MSGGIANSTIAAWEDEISKQSDASGDEVRSVLEANGIRPQSILPRPRTMNIRSIHLAGVKHGHGQDDRFIFDWNNLGPGLWALLSDGNSKGKSSILATVRAALQGRFPGQIKPDVWGWFDTVRITFAIDEIVYEVSVLKTVGSQKEAEAVGVLKRKFGPTTTELYNGPADEGLEQALSDLFLDELGFAKFQAYRSAAGTISEHGWPVMSSALFIAGPGSAIFGDHTEDGLSTRLIQLFIGLPWISTYTAASSALKKNDAAARRMRDSNFHAGRIHERINSLTSDLKTMRDKFAGLTDRRNIREELSTLDARVADAQADVTAGRRAHQLAQIILDDAVNVHVEARRLLQHAKDEAAAGYVFRRLKPVCCPACEGSFAAGRFEDKVVETCGLCGNNDLPANDGYAADTASLDDAVQDSEVARKNANQRLLQAKSDLDNAESLRNGILKELNSLQSELSNGDPGSDLMSKIAITEGRIEELQNTVGTEPPANGYDEKQIAILKAAESVTKKKMELLQSEILADVSAALMALCIEFGIQNLESMNLKSNKLDISQGGAPMTFTKLSPGEKLRVRIAAALATLQVARDRGFGRHPGLIVLDSPGAQEMSADDFSTLIGRVKSVADRFPGVQIIVGAVNREELKTVVPVANLRQALGAAELF